MARYNIELRTEQPVWETVQHAAVNHSAMRIELAKSVGELLRDHADRIWKHEEWRIDVTDERGLILYVMRIETSDAAATMMLRR